MTISTSGLFHRTLRHLALCTISIIGWSGGQQTISAQGVVTFQNASTAAGWNPVADRNVRWSPSAASFNPLLVAGDNVASNYAGLNFSTLRAALYYAPGTVSDANWQQVNLAASGGSATFKQSTSATRGSWFGGTRTLDTIANQSGTASLMVVVWNSALSSDPFSAAAQTGLWGRSPVFGYTTPAGTTPAPSEFLPNNLTSFTVGYNPQFPFITTSPVSVVLTTGGTTTFSVTAVGAPVLLYQWRKENVAIPGATFPSLTLSNVALADAGNYDVMVSNNNGSTTSTNAVLQVLPSNAPSIRVNNLLAAPTTMAAASANITITGGFSGGLIFYTLDGSTPTTSSALYNTSFTLTNTTTIRAMSLSADFLQTVEAPAVTLIVVPVYSLTTTVTGSGAIGLNPAAGPYLSNSVVTLTAQATTNWAFDHWTGALSGSANPANLIMNSPKSVQAVFIPTAYPLTVIAPGGGSRTANGLNIPPNTYYPTGSVVSLEATPDAGWSFLRWEGTAAGTANPFNVTMNQTQMVQVIFGTVVSTNTLGNGRIVLSTSNPVPYGTSLTNTAVPDPGYYFVTWTGTVSGTNNPTSFTVTAATPSVGALFATLPAPTIVAQPTNTAVVLGSSAIFQVQATGAAPLTYQWRKSGANIDGAVSTNFTIATTVATDAGNYDVVVVNAFGSSVTSAVATLTVLLPPTVTQSPLSRQVINGSNTTFTITATGTSLLSYQWRKNGANLGGAVATNYTITGVSTNHEGSYDVVVSNPYGSVTSAVATLTVVFLPTITTHPLDQTVASGNSVGLSVSATGTTPLSYRWRYESEFISEATNATFTINPALTNSAGNYSVIVTNPYGMVTSATAAVTVYVPVAIASHPFSLVTPWHGTAIFNVGATGYPAPNYQWLFNGVNIPGATGSSLVITNVGTNALGYYWVEAWNTYSATTSSPAVLLMSPSLREPFAGVVGIWGKEATLSVGALGSGTLTYQWYKSGVPVPGATNATLLFPSLQIGDGGLYSIVVTSEYGSVTNTPAQLVVNPANISLGLYAGVIIEGVAGYSYGIEYTTDLQDTNSWQILTNVTLTQPVEVWVDESINVHSPQAVRRFYRVTGQQSQ